MRNNIKNILIVRTNGLGDLLMSLPLLSCIRRDYPDAKICLLCVEQNKGLLEQCPDVDEFIYLKEEKIKGVFNRIKFFIKLKQYRFDMVILATSRNLFNWMMWLLRVPVRVGFDRKMPFFLNRKAKDKTKKNIKHEIDNILDLAYTVCKSKWDGKMFLSEGHRNRSVRRDRKRVAVHMTRVSVERCWPVENFFEVCNILKKQGHEVVLIGAEKTEKIKEVFGDCDGMEDLIGKTSTEELVGVLADVDCLLSMDTGPYHLAWMQKTPVVGIFIKEQDISDPKVWGVYPGYVKCEEIWDYLSNITVKRVVNAVNAVIEE